VAVRVVSAAAFAARGRKAAREALRADVDRLELVLLDQTIEAAASEEDRDKAIEALNYANDRLQKARDERDATALQLRAMRAKGGAF
jgi:hypothetical protein